jgi:hypothetical protein
MIDLVYDELADVFKSIEEAGDKAARSLELKPGRESIVHCRDCRFWVPYHKDQGDCTLPYGVARFGVEGNFDTDPDFGCIQGERK